MAPAGTLYTYADNFRSHKILIAAQYSGAKVKCVSSEPEFIFGETNKAEDFTKKFPFGKVPAFETSDGDHIFESAAIAHYVANEELRGKTPVEQSQVVQWISFSETELLPLACTWLFPIHGVIQYNKQATEQAKDSLKRLLSSLDQCLLTRTYLVGQTITLADISVASYLVELYRLVFEPSFREPYQNVNRWFVTLVNQPHFKTVLGEVQLCDKAAQFDPKKFAETQGKKAPASEKKQKSGSAEKPEKKKEEKKEEAVNGNDVDEGDPMDDILAQEPKSKDPFEQFPKGTLNMDAFKKVYSNESEEVSVKYFWENFDKENYSIWYCEYKYSDELALVFMSCNLITGMFQRLDKMRKNAFGSMILFGEDHKSTISGIWIWRGHDLAFNLSPDWQVDHESYEWKKLDPETDATKTIVNEYLSWSGEFDGKKFNQGKIFK